MVLPVVGHRLPFFADLRDRSNPAYLIGEGTEALGLLGSVGLIALLCLAIYRLSKPRAGLSTGLSTFTVVAILLCMVGGLSQVIAVLGFTQLRVWSRMSIVIAFPAIVFAIVLLNRLLLKQGRAVTILVMVTVTSLSILDTNPGRQLPSFSDTARAWELDRDLVHKVEKLAGENALIFQLPVVPFPENPPVVNMTDYEHLRGYLHSETLRWSYGGVKGREQFVPPDYRKSMTRFLDEIKRQGFTILWVDQRGFEDRGLTIRDYFRSVSTLPIANTVDIEVYSLTQTGLNAE
jgi:phosphoglycerol transferase